MTITVAQAEQQLAAAKAEAVKLERENSLAEIQRLTQQGAPLRERYQYLHGRVAVSSQNTFRLRQQLLPLWREYQSLLVPFDPTEFPSAAMIRSRRQAAAKALADHTALIKNITSEESQARSERREAMALAQQLEGLHNRIEHLKHVVAGTKPGALPEGGVFMGVEDFIGSGPFVRP